MNDHFFSDLPQSDTHLPTPEPPRKRIAIFPIFIPFAGCKERCVFCAQDKQTGQPPESIASILEKANKTLLVRFQETGRPVEIAFFGGTFTALPSDDWQHCLTYAKRWYSAGIANAFRCSTRPDSLMPKRLDALREHQFTTVELGIQSFSAAALTLSRRGYSPQTAHTACAEIRKMGFALGLQLMPGMPGATKNDAVNDIFAAIEATPDFVRLYPCLVIHGTPLARMWHRQAYMPWTLAETTLFLSKACLQFWEHNIPIIRMGIAQDQALKNVVLAGPWHPSLGNAVKGAAIALYLQKHLHKLSQRITPQASSSAAGPLLFAPKHLQGDFWGYKKCLVPFYAHLGITPTSTGWHEKKSFIFTEKLLASLSADCHTLPLPQIFGDNEETYAYF